MNEFSIENIVLRSHTLKIHILQKVHLKAKNVFWNKNLPYHTYNAREISHERKDYQLHGPDGVRLMFLQRALRNLSNNQTMSHRSRELTKELKPTKCSNGIVGIMQLKIGRCEMYVLVELADIFNNETHETTLTLIVQVTGTEKLHK